MSISLSVANGSLYEACRLSVRRCEAHNVRVGDSPRSATRPAEHHMPTYKDKAVQPPAIDIITRICGIVVNKALRLFWLI
jgi:hypothetical protein